MITPGNWWQGLANVDPGEYAPDGLVWAPPSPEDLKEWDERSRKEGGINPFDSPEPILVATCNRVGDSAAIAHLPQMLAALQDALTLLSGRLDPEADELADRIVGILHRAVPGLEPATVKDHPRPQKPHGRCQVQGCVQEATGTVYSRGESQVLVCCDEHRRTSLDADLPAHIHSCENCGCLLPVN